MFKHNLPAQSTIRAWYGAIDGKPGFSIEAKEALKRKAEEAKMLGRKLVGCLMVDEMAIRKQIELKYNESRYTGYVDFGSSLPQSDETPIANEALVY